MQVFQNHFYGSSQIIDFLTSLFADEFFSFLPFSFLSFLSFCPFFCFSFNISLGELCKNSKYGNLVCDIEMNLSLSQCMQVLSTYEAHQNRVASMSKNYLCTWLSGSFFGSVFEVSLYSWTSILCSTSMQFSLT